MKAAHSTRTANYRRVLKAKARKPKIGKRHSKSWYSAKSVRRRAVAKAKRIKAHDRSLLRAAQKRAAARARSNAKRGASRQLAYARSLSRSQAAWRRKH